MEKTGEKSRSKKKEARVSAGSDVSLKKLADQTREDFADDRKQTEQQTEEARDHQVGHIAEKEIAKVTIVPAEKGYVRDPKGEFNDTRQSSYSPRMKRVGVLLTPEMIEGLNICVDLAGTKQSNWIRAALRKAMREGVDVEYELENEILLAAEAWTSGPARPPEND